MAIALRAKIPFQYDSLCLFILIIVSSDLWIYVVTTTSSTVQHDPAGVGTHPGSSFDWLRAQVEFRSENANVVRSYVEQLLLNGTLTLLPALPAVPPYVPQALARAGMPTEDAARIWRRFMEETNPKSSPSGRCRSELRRRARFQLWLRQLGRGLDQQIGSASEDLSARRLSPMGGA